MSRGEVLPFDGPGAAERAVPLWWQSTSLGSEHGRGDLLPVLISTPEKNTLVWGFNYTCGI